jgi:hypothetical protein
VSNEGAAAPVPVSDFGIGFDGQRPRNDCQAAPNEEELAAGSTRLRRLETLHVPLYLVNVGLS